MIRKMKLTLPVIVVAAFALGACQGMESNKAGAKKETSMHKEVVTSEKQKALTPEQVVADFKSGNERFVKGELWHRDHLSMAKATASGGQFPKAAIISCVDSRVPVEYVLDQGIGDVFVGRVAGNFVDTGLLGSLEFATKVSGSKVVLILGHESCGAVKAAIDDVKLANITGMLEYIKPAVSASGDYKGDKTSANAEFVSIVVEENVRQTIAKIRQESPIMREMEEKGEIKIIGGVYDLDTGKINFIES
jgi:carbonic anhydrase